MNQVIRVFGFAVVFCLLFTGISFAQPEIAGKWKTIDDETNQPKSIVSIFERDGKYYGKIEELFLKEGDNPNPTCDKCPEKDPRKDQPTKGMEIIKDMVEKGEKFKGGTILDPKKGKVYTCEIWREGENLKVRGYIAFFYRTQTWLPAE